ncbi:MAG: stage III sporulation protein AE [Lachnospiraceae bacterium]|nr:stage III sporulation protein AE [Lachnospiraceae bacterium]
MKRIKKLCFLAVLWGLLMGNGTLSYAKEIDGDEADRQYVDYWLSSTDLSGMDEGIKSLFPEVQIDAGELLRLILDGKILEAGKRLFSQLKGSLRGEVQNIRRIFLYLLVLGVLSALFSGFSDLFSGQQIAQAGFYFLYLFLMVVLTGAFLMAAEVAAKAVENIVLFVKLFIPAYFTAAGTAGGETAAVCYYQLMLLAVYFVEGFVSGMLLPLVYSYVLLALLNGVWAEEKLALLLDLMKKGIGAALKLSLGAVTGLSLVQSVIVPVADRLKISAFRKTVSSIPGIGSAAEGVAELMLGSAVLLKNSIGVLMLLLLLLSCLLPLLRILLVTGAVKLGAAIAGIVSDKRFSGCADRVGEGCLLLLRCVFTSMALFIIVIAVAAYTISY